MIQEQDLTLYQAQQTGVSSAESGLDTSIDVHINVITNNPTKYKIAINSKQSNIKNSIDIFLTGCFKHLNTIFPVFSVYTTS